MSTEENYQTELDCELGSGAIEEKTALEQQRTTATHSLDQVRRSDTHQTIDDQDLGDRSCTDRVLGRLVAVHPLVANVEVSQRRFACIFILLLYSILISALVFYGTVLAGRDPFVVQSNLIDKVAADFPEYAYICLKRAKNSLGNVTYYSYATYTSNSSYIQPEVSIEPSLFYDNRDCIKITFNVDYVSNQTWAAITPPAVEFISLFSMGPKIADSAVQIYFPGRSGAADLDVSPARFIYGTADTFSGKALGNVISVSKTKYKFMGKPETVNWTAQQSPVEVSFQFLASYKDRKYQFSELCSPNVRNSVCSNQTDLVRSFPTYNSTTETNAHCSLQKDECLMMLYVLFIRDSVMVPFYKEQSQLSFGVMLTTAASWHNIIVAIFAVVYVVHPATDVIRVNRVSIKKVDDEMLQKKKLRLLGSFRRRTGNNAKAKEKENPQDEETATAHSKQ